MAVIGNAPALGIITGDNILDGSITAADLAPGAAVPSQTGNAGKYLTTDGTDSSWGALSVVKITSIDYAGDDLAADPAGGQTITVTGSGFVDTPTVYVNDTIAPSVSFVSSTEITFTTPAKTAGTYNLYVINTDGSTAIKVMGVSYSGTPAWTTSAGSLGTLDVPLSIQLEATSNSAITYTLSSGSSLPSGVTLSSTGLIEGSVDTDQTFSFSVDATDEENQETPRSFSVTVSTGDAQFHYVTMLLQGEGTNAAQNNTFLDSSANNFTVTRAGNPTQGSFSPYGPNWANYFDGSSDYLTNSSNYLIANTTTTFTIEGWVYMTSAPTDDANDIPAMISVNCGGGNDATNYMGFGPISSRKLRMRWFDGASKYAEGSTTLALNTWYHVAVAVSSNTIKLFVNGFTETLTGTTTLTNRGANANGFALGQSYTYSNYTGYLSNVRVISGTALYSANFAPSTTPLTAVSGTVLLTCQSNRFFDASTNAYAVTPVGHVSVQRFSPFRPTSAYSTATIGGSGYFDGTGDYLSVANNSALQLNSSMFTVEGWFYTSVSGSDSNYPISQCTGSAESGINWFVRTVNTNKCRLVLMVGGSASVLDSADNIQINAWNHFAVTCDGTGSGANVRMWLNGFYQGVLVFNIATLNANSAATVVGSWVGAGTYMNGYVADIRVIKGAAQYTGTSNITVPTAPLTAVANTSLLHSMTNAAIRDGAMMHDLETVGDAQISTSVKKYGTGSLKFDGTGDYLVAKASPQFAFTGDVTIECWVYASVLSGAAVFGICGTHSGSSDSKTLIYVYSTGSLGIGKVGTNEIVSTSGVITTGTWYYIAAVRNGNTTTLYVNGNSVASGTTAVWTTSVEPMYVGYVNPAHGATWNGYIDDLRITNGYARTITTPTSAFKGK